MSLSNLKPRSDSAVVRNHIAEIEDALSRGASREAVYEALKEEHKLTLSFNAFVKALYRARAKVKESGLYKPDPAREESGLHKQETSTTEKVDESSSNPTQPRAKKGPLKKGAFAPPKDFDPTEFDKRFK